MRTMMLVLAAACGFFFGHANPLVHVPCLVLLSPFALTLLGQGTTPRRAAWRGWLAGTAGYAAALYWIAIPVHDFAFLPWFLAVPCPILLGAGGGMFTGLFTWAACVAWRRAMPLWLAGIWLGLAWYLLECLSGVIVTGFPWLPLAAAFAPWPFMTGMAAIVGAFGLSGILAGAAGCAAFGRRGMAAGACIVACVAAFGVARLSCDIPAAGPGVPVGIVQGNVDQHVKWTAAALRSTIGEYLALSRGMTEPGQGQKDTASGIVPPGEREHVPGAPALVVWPETAMPFDIERQPGRAVPLQTFSQGLGVSILTGALGFDAASRRYINRAYLLRGDASPAWYEKEHLVPFGEYIPPLINIDCLRGLLQGFGSFIPGTSIAPLPVGGRAPGLVVGVLICYESIFPELAASRVADGATVLVNISNDAWFGRSSAPAQHLHAGLLRSVEQGRPLVRAANTGISAFGDAHGRLQAGTDLFVQTALTRVVVPTDPSYRTVFASIGALLPGVAVLAVLLIWWRTRRRITKEA